MSVHGFWKDLPVFPRYRFNTAVMEKFHQLQVVVFVEAASDFAAVFPVTADEVFDRAAVGDVALAAAAHQELGTGPVSYTHLMETFWDWRED